MSDGENDDKAAKIAAIKARMAQAKAGGAAPAAAPAAGAPAAAAGSAAPAAAPAGEDLAARIAALKAKVETAKASTATAATAASPAAAHGGGHAKKGGGGKNIYPVEPINRTGFGDERLYRDNTINRWFVVAGLLLTVSVLAMWKRDHDRDWKPIQAEHRLLKLIALRGDLAAAEAAVDPAAKADLEARKLAAEADLDAREAELDDLRAGRSELDGRYYAANQTYQIRKSELDALRYEYEEQRLLHGDDASLLADADETLAALQQEVAERLADADAAKTALDAASASIKTAEADLTEVQRSLEALEEQTTLVRTSLAKIEPSLFNDWVRNMPMADMLAPTLRVEKIVLDKLKDNYNFMHVGKVDMCTTCHVSIADPAFSDWDPANEKPWHELQGGSVVEDAGKVGQRVFNAHPRLDLFVSDTSPHPMGTFGCTTCHLGRGQAVEFERTFHTPTADAFETAAGKQARWEADLGYDPSRHYWDWPMTPSDKLYSSCFTCHAQTDRLPGAPEYNESRALIEDLGCYGCHKVKGLEHLRKPGPDLTRLAVKTSPEWARKWVLSPQSFRPSTRMPHFWHQSNSGAPASATISPDKEWRNNADRFVPDWSRRNEVEARALLAYVFDQSRQAIGQEGFELDPVPATAGDAEQGKRIFEQRGCLGCHSVQSEGWTENWHGPELSSVGSKTTPQWLYNWIRDPRRYFPDSVMPDLRLTDEEAWHVTAWLMGKTDPDWTAQRDALADMAIVDQIVVENLTSVAGDAWAVSRVAELRAEGGDAAVELFAGEKLFQRYGCAGCHLVPGHAADVGIGTELTYEALKELTKFDFGHEAAHGSPEAIAHSLPAWFERKLTDPRIFDRLPVIGKDASGAHVVTHYEQKVKLPGEKLKMPNYYLGPEEVALVVQFLLGTRDDGIDATMKRTLSADEQLVEQGSRLITQYNCVGCHRMGQLPTRLPITGETPEEQVAAVESLVEESLRNGLWMAAPMASGDVTLFHPGEWLSDEFYLPSEEETWDVVEFFEDADLGGPVPAYVDVFGHGEGGMGRYIEDAALRPPVLRREGEKVDPEWLFGFLREPFVVRTHVNVRMPSFGLDEQESLALVRWFAAQDDQPWPFETDTDPVPDQELYDKGENWFTNVFQCNKCHPAGDTQPADPNPLNWGPDLGLTKERLKPQWVANWLLNPPTYQPGTRMPSFFGEFSDGEYEAMFEDYELRVAALVHYLKHMGEVGEPAAGE